MNIIILLLACSMVIAVVFLIGFIWSVNSGQYDDTSTPAYRMLMDNKAHIPPNRRTPKAKVTFSPNKDQISPKPDFYQFILPTIPQNLLKN